MSKTIDDAMGNLRALERAIAAGPHDAVIAVSPENVRYVGDVHISTQVSIRDRLALIVWAKDRAPVFVLCAVEEAFVRANSWISDIRPFKEFVTTPMSVVAGVLRELGLARGNIGIELDYLAASYLEELRRSLPGIAVSSCTGVFAEARIIKTAREKELLANAYRATEKALLATYATIHEGETEKSMANRLSDAIMHSGADLVAYLHINAGPNTGFPHMAPGGYQVKRGDIVKADVGGWYQEYITNVGRTAKLGAPNEEDLSYWRRLRAIHHEIIDLLRPGNTGRQLFERATVLHQEAGLPFPYAHNGHSVGLQVHEHPLVNPFEDIPYRPGMVSTVETRVRFVGKVGYHMEDLVEITDGAPKILSDAFDNEEIFVI